MKNPPLLALLLIAVPMLAVGAGLTPVQPAPASKTAPKPGTAPKAVPPSAPQLPVPGLWGQNSPLPIRINSATLSPTIKTGSVTKELALSVVVANVGANPANPFRIKVSYEAMPSSSAGTVGWAQGLGRGKTDSKTQLIYPPRESFKDGKVCVLLAIEPMARSPLPPPGPPVRACTAPGAVVAPPPPTPLDPDCPPENVQPGLLGNPASCIAPNPLPSNGSSVSLANVVPRTDLAMTVYSGDAYNTRLGMPAGTRLVGFTLTLNYNLILPGDAVADSTGNRGWISYGRTGFSSSRGALPPGSGNFNAGPLIEAQCPPNTSTYPSTPVTVVLGYFKRTADARNILTLKPIGAPVVLAVDVSSVCRAAFATN